MTLERTQFQIDGGELAVWSAGPEGGPRVLLLHGYLGSHLSWRHQMPALAERGCRVVAPDWFGWGESGSASTATYEDDLARVGELIDQLGWSSCMLAGHDYGGFIALGFAEANAHRVDGLAIVNSRAHGTFRPLWYAAFSLTSIVASSWLVRPLLRIMPIRAIHRFFLRRERRDGHVSDEALRSYTRQLDARTITHIFRDYECAVRPELGARLGELTMPVQVIWGSDDRFLSVDIAHELEETIPGAELELVEDAGHFITEERPGVVTEALLMWMQRVEHETASHAGPQSG